MKSIHSAILSAVAALAISGCSADSDSDAGVAAGPCDLSSVAAEQCVRAHALNLPAALPASRGNKFADNEDAAVFGFRLFFDSSLGSGVACVNCHAPELAFTDRRSVSVGTGTGNRNAPTVFNVARLSVIFWDGRADSVWSQPLFAFENTAEMDSSRLELAQLIKKNDLHRTNYEKVFGALPDMTSWPPTGMPGDPAFDAMPETQKDEVNRIVANVGKSFEAYERKNVSSEAPLDLFLKGDSTQMLAIAQRGLNVFLAQGCDKCHGGPMLTDESFHDVGFPSLPNALPDSGRLGGLPVLENNIFNLKGPFADPGPGVPGNDAAPLMDVVKPGEFRTPSLRNVSRTSPYGHDGALDSLSAVLAIHAVGLSDTEKGELLAFFDTLNGTYPPKPWNNWPLAQ